MQNKYDVQQVCENGHQITDCYNINPDKRSKFCKDCGESTITNCPSCSAEIQGAKLELYQSWIDARNGHHNIRREVPADVPSYCANCGKPFPWTEKRIQNAVQIMMEFGELNEQEMKTINQDIQNIAKDTPDAELSARRIKRIWDRGKNIGYEAIMELASRTAAKIFKGQ